jgi:hypothetical protein
MIRISGFNNFRGYKLVVYKYYKYRLLTPGGPIDWHLSPVTVTAGNYDGDKE